jgi:hypothetical protein
MRIILFFFLLINLSSQAQENFIFNQFTIYEPQTSNKEFRYKIIITNSVDNFNYLVINKNFKDFYAVVYDFKKKQKHFFDVVVKKDIRNTDNPFLFKYVFSSRTEIFDCSWFRRDYKIERIDDNNLKIIRYKNSNKNKIAFTYNLTGINSESNFFNNFKSYALYYFDNCTILDRNNKFLVESAIIKDAKNKVINKIDLLNYGKIDLEINIDELRFENLEFELNFLRNR